MAESRDRPAFLRTTCACEEDRAHCKEKPGHLIPSDIGRIADKLLELGVIQRRADVTDYLRASAGSRILYIDRATGTNEVLVVPSITPARWKGGRCVFLTEDERCQIHEVSPFGCAYFDAHMGKQEADGRVLWGMAQMAESPAYQALRAQLLDKEEEPTESDKHKLEACHGQE